MYRMPYRTLRVGVLFAMSEHIFQIMTGVLDIIPQCLCLCVCVWPSPNIIIDMQLASQSLWCSQTFLISCHRLLHLLFKIRSRNVLMFSNLFNVIYNLVPFNHSWTQGGIFTQTNSQLIVRSSCSWTHQHLTLARRSRGIEPEPTTCCTSRATTQLTLAVFRPARMEPVPVPAPVPLGTKVLTGERAAFRPFKVNAWCVIDRGRGQKQGRTKVENNNHDTAICTQIIHLLFVYPLFILLDEMCVCVLLAQSTF